MSAAAPGVARVTMLTNPAAGHGNAPHAAERAVARLQQRGVDVTAVVGRDPAHARDLVEQAVAAGTDALVVVGGDGVISLALQSLARSGVPLGIVPAGTGNDHAREYGIPTDDPRAAADVIADGHAHTVDLGRIEGAEVTSWFGTVMAAGFDSLVSDRTNRMRWPRGRMRYNLAILAELSRLRPLPFTLAFDGGQPVHTELTLAALGITRSYGGGMRICPHADHGDGLLDITMVRAGSRLRLLRLFPTVFTGAHVDLEEVSTARARTVRVDCPGINAYADGDYVAPLPVTVTAVPGALQILRPR
ncbi:diacylglycerol kinase [Mycolicibacillus parakoreensis]|uniref:Diacylglycerol kinase n=1 Tax=Mycolicibacillus parakoreensis TaxID=1069221 RepID=A0ABY3U977_9MYCO|nr:diacylglycerol kinase [Mycolicibacillus parakoreensis]ULN54506.2 diacylglycerol kinase [Mycolicibacillus parakoreensis]